MVTRVCQGASGTRAPISGTTLSPAPLPLMGPESNVVAPFRAHKAHETNGKIRFRLLWDVFTPWESLRGGLMLPTPKLHGDRMAESKAGGAGHFVSEILIVWLISSINLSRVLCRRFCNLYLKPWSLMCLCKQLPWNHESGLSKPCSLSAPHVYFFFTEFLSLLTWVSPAVTRGKVWMHCSHLACLCRILQCLQPQPRQFCSCCPPSLHPNPLSLPLAPLSIKTNQNQTISSSKNSSSLNVLNC